MTTEELFASWRGARVQITFADGFSLSAVAVFVYEVPGGVVYVGPGYRDEWGADRASHFIEGQVAVVDNGATVSVVGTRLRADFSPIDEEDGGKDGFVVYEFSESLRSAGLTWDAERERMRPAANRNFKRHLPRGE